MTNIQLKMPSQGACRIIHHVQWQHQARFLEHEVVKYHRTVATYTNTVIDAGFTIAKLSEPQPTPELLETHPAWQDETRRPMFLLIAAVKQEQ